MRYLKSYSHRRALLRHGWRVCKLCYGAGGEWEEVFTMVFSDAYDPYGTPKWRPKWSSCGCVDGLRDDEAMKIYRRVK